MNIFLICPVRNATPSQKKTMASYINSLEKSGNNVFYPARDNPYEFTDDVGYDICKTNCEAIKNADVVHIFWDKNSTGSLFDLGSAFALNKPLQIVNIGEVKQTINKSFSNMIMAWSRE